MKEKLAHEFWWQAEKIARHLWEALNWFDRASYWFDPVPAFCYRKRHEAQWRLELRRGYEATLAVTDRLNRDYLARTFEQAPW